MLTVSFWLILSRVISLGIDDSLILVSNSTPTDMLSYFLSQQVLNLDIIPRIQLPILIIEKRFLFMLDLTYSKSFTSLINSLSLQSNSPYLSIFESETRSLNRLEVHLPLESEFKSLLSLLNSFKLSSYTILSSSKLEDSLLAEKFKDEPGAEIHFYSDQMTKESSDSLVLKLLKTKGVKCVIIIDSSQSLETLESSLVSKRWAKQGVVLIYSSRSISRSSILGGLKVEEEGTRDSFNSSDFHFKAIIGYLNRLTEEIEKSREKEIFSELMNKSLKPGVFLTNFQPDSKKVGFFDKTNHSLAIFSPIIYPGNVSNLISSSKSRIMLSIANGTNDPYNSYKYSYFSYLFNGANHAISKINSNDEIKNFELVLLPNDCGVTWYDPVWYSSCFASIIHNFGIGFITSFMSSAIKGNIFSLRSLNKKVPHISPLGQNVQLENSTLFPELVKLDNSREIYVSTQYLFLRTLGYTDIVVIASNDSAGLEVYLFTKNIIEKSGLRIVNDENSRFINSRYTRENFTVYKEVFERIRKTRCTVFAIITTFREMILEALYDVGYRKGELLFLADTSIINSLDTVEEPFFTKRKELVSSTIIFSYREFVGALGEQIKRELNSMYQELTYMCMTYDTVTIFKDAINYLIAFGDDFENYDKLMKTIRMNKIVGCLGKVFFQSYGNSRSSGQLLIQQVYYNSTLESLRTIDVAYFDRYSSLMINQITEFEWAGGEMPLNFIPLSECGFEIDSERESIKGKNLLYFLSLGLFIASLFSGIFTIIKSEKKLNDLTEKTVLTFEDILFHSYFAFEAIQFISYGPDQEGFKEILSDIHFLLSFDLYDYFSITGDKFWYLYISVLILTSLWIFFCLIKLSHLDYLLPGSIRDRYEALSKIFLVIIGHLLFIPCFSMLLNLYSCNRSVGEDLTDSFLDRDCDQYCYKGSHKDYAIVTYIVLFFFLTLGIYQKPKHQEHATSLNLRTKPLALVIQTLVQIIAVILSKTLKEENQVAHGVTLSLLLTALLVFIIFFQPYNFRRPLIAHCGFIIASIWTIVISCIFFNRGKIIELLSVQFSGLLFIFSITFYTFKKSPEILYTEKGKNIATLFIFQFCKDHEKYLGNFEIIQDKYLDPQSSRS